MGEGSVYMHSSSGSSSSGSGDGSGSGSDILCEGMIRQCLGLRALEKGQDV